MGDQGSVVLGGRGRVDPLQPGMALNLLQGSPSLGIPLKHAVYQTEARGEERGGIGREEGQQERKSTNFKLI